MKDQSTTSWVLTPRGKDRFVDEMEDPNISRNVPSINLLKEQANSKGTSVYEDVEQSVRKRELVMNSSNSGRLETDPSNIRSDQYALRKELL